MIPMPNPKKRKSGESHVASYEVVREMEDEIVLRFVSKKGAFQIVLRSECEGVRNVYRIIRGRIIQCDSGKVYSKDDTIIAKDIIEDIVFDVLEETEFYWTTSKKVFDMIHDESQMIMDNLDEVQNKDHYTREHTLRVNDLAKRLGLKLGMSGRDIADLSLAALAHDVGKVAIEDDILNKPARLTDQEYEIMKRHVIESVKIIEGKVTDAVSTIVIQHHERLDGSGYPRGLVDGEICFAAKVLAVADSYDAMTSVRPYNRARTREEAFEELRKEAGKLFDPSVVGTFIKYIDVIDMELM